MENMLPAQPGTDLDMPEGLPFETTQQKEFLEELGQA